MSGRASTGRLNFNMACAYDPCDKLERLFRAIGSAFIEIPLNTRQLVGYMRDAEDRLIAGLGEGVKCGSFHFDGKHTRVPGGFDGIGGLAKWCVCRRSH